MIRQTVLFALLLAALLFWVMAGVVQARPCNRKHPAEHPADGGSLEIAYHPTRPLWALRYADGSIHLLEVR